MSLKEKKIKEIKNNLSIVPNIIFYDKKDIFSIIDFLGKRNSDNINYNSSVFHFITYFCYKPKLAFIVKTKDSVFFSSYSGKNFDKLILSIPYYSSRKKALLDLIEILKKLDYNNLLFRDLDDDFINILRSDFKEIIKPRSLKEIYYANYDISKTLALKGKKFSNLRWHLNSFEKANHNIEIVDLKDKIKDVIHLIGKWRSMTIKERGFSFIDVRSDKMAANFFGKNNFDKVISNVLKIDGIVSAFNLGYEIGSNSFAHSVGICDISIPHLAEFSQYNFWKEIKEQKYRFINDGPTWRKSLGEFKNKFCPISKKRFYWLDF